MLLKDARELSTDLAKASAVLAEAAYGNGSTANTLIVDTLSSSMGYNCDDYGSYAKVNSLTIWDNDHVGFVVGKKVYKDKVLYCVPIKGTSANAEWHSDFHSGDPGENDGFHKGFYRAAQEVITALQSSFAQDGDRERFIWLTGHSRGAAVANLVAGLLTDSQTYASANHIFCYTFACPAVGLSSRVSGYPNIVNYINIGDPIPMMPLESWGYARYGRDITQNLNSLPNFLRNFKAWKNDAYCGASREDDWLGLLQQIVPERDSNMILREMLAYFLGGKNDITFTSFSAYMLSEYSYDLAKLGVKAVTKNTLIGDFIDMIETVIETEENMQKDLDRFWEEYNSAEDADEKQAVFNRYSSLFGSMEKLLGVTINTVSDINPAQVKLLDYLNTARAMIETLNSAVGLLVDTDGHFVTAIEHAHHHRTYILWVNSWYCGYESWRGTDITNPATVSECKLDECTTIGVRTFQDCTSISSLSFPSNLAYIGASAFSGVKYIETLTLPDTLESIGTYAFSNCTGLTSVTLPIQVSLTRVFASTNNVKTIHYTPGRIGTMSDRANENYGYSLEFAAKDSLEEITIDEGVTHIGAYAFYGDSIKLLTGGKLPSTLESIGEYAFYGNALMSIDGLPAGLTSLGSYSFYNSGLTDFVMPEGITAIPDNCFNGCKGLTTLEIPTWVTSIGSYAFHDCTGLESVTLPIERSELRVFANCTGVKSIHYTVQGNGAMPDRTNDNYGYSLEWAAHETLESVAFDEGVTRIADYAFYNCSAMTINGLPSSLTSLGVYSFYNTAITNFVVPEGLTEIPTNCFYGCKALTALEIPNWVTSIGSYAFSNCTGLDSVTLPIERSEIRVFTNCPGVKSIHYTVKGDGAMPDRANDTYGYSLEWAAHETLESVTFDEGVTRIADYAFYNCSAMTINGLPSTLTSLGANSFYNTAITNFVIPEGVTVILANCFYGCKGLTTLEIPTWVTSIGSYAFHDCTGLESVTLPIERSELRVFANCTGVKSIHYTVQGDGAMPDRTNDTYGYSLEWAAHETLESVTFDEGVTHIGAYAFYRNDGKGFDSYHTRVVNITDSASVAGERTIEHTIILAIPE